MLPDLAITSALGLSLSIIFTTMIMFSSSKDEMKCFVWVFVWEPKRRCSHVIFQSWCVVEQFCESYFSITVTNLLLIFKIYMIQSDYNFLLVTHTSLLNNWSRTKLMQPWLLKAPNFILCFHMLFSSMDLLLLLSPLF